MPGAQSIEAEFPALCRHESHSAAWRRTWRRLHLRKYPNADRQTRDNLTMLVRMAQQREVVR